MSWFVNGRNSAIDTVQCEVVYVHHVSVRGKCTMCGNAFNVAFTKEYPDGLFGPQATFECPCGHFVYDPEDNSHRTKDTSKTPKQLRTIYDMATSEGVAR